MLIDVRQMIKAELGHALLPAQIDALMNRKVLQTQVWLSTMHPWPHMRGRFDINISAGQRFCDIPTRDGRRINLDASPTAWVKVPADTANTWYPLEYGITSRDYNQYDSAYDQQAALPSRWMLSLNDPQDTSDLPTAKIELWPVPNQAALFRLEGQFHLRSQPTDLVDQANVKGAGNTPAGDDALPVDLDGLLLAYHVAASMQTVNKELSTTLAAKAGQRFNQLRAAGSNDSGTFVLGKQQHFNYDRFLLTR